VLAALACYQIFRWMSAPPQGWGPTAASSDTPSFSQPSGPLDILKPGDYTMRSLSVLFMIAVLVSSATAQGKKGKGLQLTDLPAPVQKTVQANLNGGEIKNIAKEKEDGVEQYEVETVLNGKARDFDVDTKGALLGIEEETTIDAIPAAAKDRILKKVGGGKVGRIESVSKPGQPMMYEAAYTDKNGKKHEVLVKTDGTETKD
jgi:hypothetical protein